MLTLFQPGAADYAHYITTYTPKFLDFPMALESVLNDARLESVVIFDIIPRSKGGLYLSSYVIQHASIPFSKTRVKDAGKKLTIVCLLFVWSGVSTCHLMYNTQASYFLRPKLRTRVKTHYCFVCCLFDLGSLLVIWCYTTRKHPIFRNKFGPPYVRCPKPHYFSKRFFKKHLFSLQN